MPAPRPETEDSVEKVSGIKTYIWLHLLLIQFIKVFVEAKTYLEVSNALQHYDARWSDLVLKFNNEKNNHLQILLQTFLFASVAPTVLFVYVLSDLKCNLCSSLKLVTFYLPSHILVQRENNFNMQ